MGQGLTIPERFVVNAANVVALGAPADVGRLLLTHLAERIGKADLSGTDILDFGCGTRFTDSIVNRGVSVKSYTGIDTNEEMIRFLREAVTQENLSYHHFDSFNFTYNKGGKPLTLLSRLPEEIGDKKFDLIAMFSVITHQIPEDSRYIFHMLRRHAAEQASLFFTAQIGETEDYYSESHPDLPTAFSCYSLELLAKLLRISGWAVVSMLPRTTGGLPMMNSFLCSPI